MQLYCKLLIFRHVLQIFPDLCCSESFWIFRHVSQIYSDQRCREVSRYYIRFPIYFLTREVRDVSGYSVRFHRYVADLRCSGYYIRFLRYFLTCNVREVSGYSVRFYRNVFPDLRCAGSFRIFRHIPQICISLPALFGKFPDIPSYSTDMYFLTWAVWEVSWYSGSDYRYVFPDLRCSGSFWIFRQIPQIWISWPVLFGKFPDIPSDSTDISAVFLQFCNVLLLRT
jgi:hypothetical protein